MRHKQIRMVQDNLQNSRLATHECISLARREKIDILALQEPYNHLNKQSDTYVIPNVSGIQAVSCSKKRFYAAICVLNPKLKVLKMVQFTNEFQVICEITSCKRAFVVDSIYFAPRNKIDSD